jgi:PAS domain S-box-containing protein
MDVPPAPTDVPLPTGLMRMVGALSLSVLAIGLVLTFLGARWVDQRIQAEAQARFERHALRLEDAIKRKFSRPLAGFQGLRSFMEASPTPVRRVAFEAWISSRNMKVDFPGVRGLGFIERVPREDLPTFLAAERADAAYRFNVHGSGNAPDMYIIKYIEPLADNQKAWGYDLGSEPVRREAIERAIRTGEPALTGAITLLQDGKKSPGYLYMLPVYAKPYGVRPSTPEQRTEMLRGLLYSPIVLAELMSDVDTAADKLLDFKVFDGNPGTLVYDHDSQPVCLPTSIHSTPCAQQTFKMIKAIDVGGRTLSVAVSGTKNFDATVERSPSGWAAVGGSLLAVLLSALMWQLGSGRARSLALAERMTQDLRGAKRQLEGALRDTDALLAALNQHAIVSTADRAGRILEVNAEFCRISGYVRQELLGQNHRIVNSGTHPPEFWEFMWRTIRSGEPWRGEVCNRAKDGSLYWMDTFIAPFMDPQGQVEKYISIRTNITRAKSDALHLQEYAKRFELAIEGGNDGLWDWLDVRRDEEWWSPQFYRLLGYAPGEIAATVTNFRGLMHPDLRESLIQLTLETLRGRGSIDLKCALRTKAGEYRWFHVRAKVYRDEQGRAMRMAGSLQDIHEQHLAREQLRTHSEQITAIFALSPDGFVSFDKENSVKLVSPAFSRLTGLDEQQVLGLGKTKFLERLQAQCSAATHTTTLETLAATAHAPGSTARVLLELITPTKRMLQLSVQRGELGDSTMVLHLRDVTHETEVDRMKSDFLSMAAHELRTPMTSIFGFSELLLRREMPPERQKDLLGRIHRHSLMVTDILNELLDLARIEARRGADFKLEPASLAGLVGEVAQDFQPPGERTAPQILVAVGAEPWARIDRSKMRQAILNLLSNAYKYSPEGGPVRVELVSKTVDGVAQHGTRITDRGMGLSAEQLAHVGERFYRADKSGNIPGTGLGISLVKEVIELMGGSMEIESREGDGTQVTLWLPALVRETAAA